MNTTELEITHTLECTELEIYALNECLASAVESLEAFGEDQLFELTKMTQSYIESNPAKTNKAFDLLFTVNAAFLNIAKYKTHLSNISMKALEKSEDISNCLLSLPINHK